MNLQGIEVPKWLFAQIMSARMQPTGCPGGHPANRRNRKPGVSARSKAKRASRERMEAECKLARFWEAEWRSGNEAVKPPWLPAKAKRWGFTDG